MLKYSQFMGVLIIVSMLLISHYNTRLFYTYALFSAADVAADP